jgi:hypothetical protein
MRGCKVLGLESRRRCAPLYLPDSGLTQLGADSRKFKDKRSLATGQHARQPSEPRTIPTMPTQERVCNSAGLTAVCETPNLSEHGERDREWKGCSHQAHGRAPWAGNRSGRHTPVTQVSHAYPIMWEALPIYSTASENRPVQCGPSWRQWRSPQSRLCRHTRGSS